MSFSDLIHNAVRYDVDAAQKHTTRITQDELKHIEYVRILWVDTVNHVKSRTVPLDYFEKLLATSRPGTSVTKAALGIVFLTVPPEFGCVHDVSRFACSKLIYAVRLARQESIFMPLICRLSENVHTSLVMPVFLVGLKRKSLFPI